MVITFSSLGKQELCVVFWPKDSSLCALCTSVEEHCASSVTSASLMVLAFRSTFRRHSLHRNGSNVYLITTKPGIMITFLNRKGMKWHSWPDVHIGMNVSNHHPLQQVPRHLRPLPVRTGIRLSFSHLTVIQYRPTYRGMTRTSFTQWQPVLST